MKPEQSIAIMKALADQSRLAMVNSLLEQSQYVEELASRHGLSPSTISFHLRKLEQAGLVSSRKEQYYTVISANDAIFDTTLRQIVSAPPAGRELQDERMDAYRRKVLESFFRNGRLEKLPAQHKKRLIVLEQLAARFAPGRRYSEQEVTGLIAPLYDDYCTVRRLLVDEGMISRDGTTYWRKAPEPGTATAGSGSLSLSAPASPAKRKDTRTDAKRQYQENAPAMGVYSIRNLVNGKIYVGSSTNLDGTRTSRLFQLRMGSAVFSRELQKELSEFGAANFVFEVLAVLERPEPGERVDQSLAALELHWLEKLQPFNDRGYNSEKAFRRNRERLARSVTDL
jgi:DNA-binding transcriptional regulator YhcF (GntR family)